MARPREFDEGAVLEAAMNCFWAQGYESTSVRTLAAEMGITGASLYNAFGDKRALYRRALDHYLEQSVRARIGRLRGLAPLAALRAFFEEIIERSLSDPDCRGCLLVNAALEVGPHDPELRTLVAQEIAEIEAFFRRCIAAGQREGAVTRARSADELGQLLLSVLLGIRVLARTRPQRAVLKGAVNGGLGLLEPDASS